jgi:hypothetical protein
MPAITGGQLQLDVTLVVIFIVPLLVIYYDISLARFKFKI